MCTCGKIVEGDVHDPNAFDVLDLVKECDAHTAYLMLFAFGQGNPECEIVYDLYLTRLCDVSFYIYTALHFFFEIGANFGLHGYKVFFFVYIVRVQEFVGDPTVVCQYDQAVGIFVESSDGKNFFESDSVSDVLFRALGGVCDNADWLIIGKIHKRFCFFIMEDFYAISFLYLVAKLRLRTIDEYLFFLDELVCSASGCVFFPCKVSVNTHGKQGLVSVCVARALFLGSFHDFGSITSGVRFTIT